MVNKNNHVFLVEDLPNENIIDDNSLFLYTTIAYGYFCGDENQNIVAPYIHYVPIEWSNKDRLEFITEVIDRYNLKINSIDVLYDAVEEKYLSEKSHDPSKYSTIVKNPSAEKAEVKAEVEEWLKNFDLSDLKELNKIHYNGAMEWVKNFTLENNPFDPRLQSVLKNLLHDTASFEDVLYMLEGSSFLPGAPLANPKMISGHKKEYNYASKLFNEFIDHTFITIDPSSSGLSDLQDDINQYLTYFTNGKLRNKPYKKPLERASVKTCENILTFNKHKEVFLEKLDSMKRKYGNEFKVANTFDGPINNLSNEVNANELRKRYRQRGFLFFHTLFSLQITGYLEILSFDSNWNLREDTYLKHQVKIRYLKKTKSNESSADSFTYQEESQSLRINDEHVDLSQSYRQRELLESLLNSNNYEKSPVNIWREIEKMGDGLLDDERKKEFEERGRNARYNLNAKIKGKADIDDDFLVKNGPLIQINQKYLD